MVRKREFLPGRARRSMQWLGVLLAHAAAIALVLQVSPQARSALGEVVHASLIPPRPLPVAPPRPEPQVKPPEPRAKPPEPRRKPVQAPQPRLAPQPAPVLTAAPREEAPPAPFVVEAPVAAPAPVPEAPAEHAAAAAPTAVAAAAPAPPAPLIPPIYNADYLDNPPPQYPATSRRLGERGRVTLRVRVSANGRAERIEIRTSSGFERLDQAAQAAVAGWRFVPARRGEEPTAAWVLIPVSFVM